VLSFQKSSGNSAGPEVDALAGVLGDFGADDHVGELETPARAQDAVDLGEHSVLVGHEVDHAVGDDDVDGFVGEGQILDQAMVQLDVGQARRLWRRRGRVRASRKSCRYR